MNREEIRDAFERSACEFAAIAQSCYRYNEKAIVRGLARLLINLMDAAEQGEAEPHILAAYDALKKSTVCERPEDFGAEDPEIQRKR